MTGLASMISFRAADISPVDNAKTIVETTSKNMVFIIACTSNCKYCAGSGE
jgi:hypothetical protein